MFVNSIKKKLYIKYIDSRFQLQFQKKSIKINLIQKSNG